MLFTIQNEIHLSLFNVNIAPSTLIACASLTASYFVLTTYIRDPRSRPDQSSTDIANRDLHPQRIAPTKHEHDRGVRRLIRRPSIFRRVTARFRANKQRTRDGTALYHESLSLKSFASFTSVASLLSLRDRLGFGNGGFDSFGGRIQSTGVEKNQRRIAQ